MQPDEYAAGFTADVEVANATSARHLAGLDGVIGASSFDCRERIRRTLKRVPPSSVPSKWAANVGSALDEWIKKVRGDANPNLLLKADLTATLPNGFVLPVHPDEIDPDEPSVTDYKTKNGLAAIRGGFADDANRFQRHLQGFAATQAGLVTGDLIVRNVFVDRSGKDPEPHVEQEPFSMDVVREATEFLGDALYAAEHDEEASKDKPRYFCKVACEHFADCRGNEIEAKFIADPDTRQRVEAFHAAKLRRDDSLELMAALRAEGLEGVTGETDKVRIVSTWVNATNRTPHWKVETEDVA